MKFRSKLLRVYLLLFMLLGLLACANTLNIDKAEALDVQGYWEMVFSGDWKAVFLIEKAQDGTLAAYTKTTKNDLLYQATKAGKVKLKGSKLELVTNPEHGVTYKGKYDTDRHGFIGALHYRDGSTHEVELVRIDTTKITGFFPAEHRNTAYRYEQPAQLDDGILTATLNENGLDEDAYLDLIQAVLSRELGEIHSVLIYEKGKLVAEDYFYDYDHTTLHRTHSVTKSVFSLVMGMLMEKQDKLNIDRTVADLLPSGMETPGAGSIRLSDLMSMTAGLPEPNFRLDGEGAWIEKFLDQVPADSLIGTFRYEDMYPELLAFLVSENMDETISSFAEHELFTPIGIDAYVWEKRAGAQYNVSSGLALTPREMLKIGILVLNKGRWNDRQLISEQWIELSTSPKVKVSEPYSYGYFWWLIDGRSMGLNGFFPVAQGAGGQRIYVIPQKNAVIVVTGGNFDTNPPLESFLIKVMNL
ncbi:MAG: beta-lactamase family protein [Candidatus Marinimicrobia bacterium]|nr:beta-lactamase family protein [Candidatus Neomarinimicrobiota bacterium]